MERSTTLIIFLMFTIVGAIIIFLFIHRAQQANPFCTAAPQCNGRVNGETFCSEGTLTRCVLKDGCMQQRDEQCACVVENSIARCSTAG